MERASEINETNVSLHWLSVLRHSSNIDGELRQRICQYNSLNIDTGENRVQQL